MCCQAGKYWNHRIVFAGRPASARQCPTRGLPHSKVAPAENTTGQSWRGHTKRLPEHRAMALFSSKSAAWLGSQSWSSHVAIHSKHKASEGLSQCARRALTRIGALTSPCVSMSRQAAERILSNERARARPCLSSRTRFPSSSAWLIVSNTTLLLQRHVF